MNKIEAAEKRYANLKYLWQQAEKEVAALKVQNADLVAVLETAPPLPMKSNIDWWFPVYDAWRDKALAKVGE